MDEIQARSMLIRANVVPAPFAWSDPAPVAVSPRYAGFWRRFFASCIDGIFLVIAARLFVSVTYAIVDVNVFDVISVLIWWAVFLGLIILISWLYYACQESSRHQATIGKRALGMIVTDRQGNRISFGRATGRFFSRYISILSLLIGYLIQPFTRKRQALHDKIAGTLVVRKQ